MTSPRVATSVLKALSPRRGPNIQRLRFTPSPKKPVKDALSPKNVENSRIVKSPFSLDTPNRSRILKNGLPDRRRPFLGSGGFGIVYQASYKGDQVAAKVIGRRKDSDVTVEAEKNAAFLRHANIVRVLDVEQGAALSLITMELCGTSLQDKLEEIALSGKERVGIWKGIACALQFCHHAGVVHADVKPKNILISKGGQPKLTDFGSSVLLNEPQEISGFRGTPGYAAPEVVRGGFPEPAADIYSLGMLAWQMISRKTPFEGLHVHTILYLTGKGTRPADGHLDDEFKGRYKRLYREMWSQVPCKRPTLSTIIGKLEELEMK